MEEDLNPKKWKTTSNKIKWKMTSKKWKMTQVLLKKSTLIGCDIIVN